MNQGATYPDPGIVWTGGTVFHGRKDELMGEQEKLEKQEKLVQLLQVYGALRDSLSKDETRKIVEAVLPLVGIEADA